MAFQTQGTSGRWSDTSQRPNPNIAAGEVRSNNMGHPYRRALPAKVGEKRGRHRQENSALGGGDTVEGPPDNTDESTMPEQKKARIEKAGESSSGDNEGVEGESRAGDDAAARKPPTDMEQRKTLLEPISDKALKTLNQEMIMMDRSARFFFCCLCYSKLNTVQFFLKHIMGLEHERKAKMFVNWNDNKQQFPFFCQVCVAPCTCESMFQDHLIGKKHAKTLTVVQELKREQYGLLPPQLLTKLMSGPPAKKVGNGISLGLSPTMLKFFSLTGPFIGLNYAEEIGEEGDPSPRYFCHICRTHMDYSNTDLHFTSTAHRHSVLSKDYPDLLAQNPRTAAKKDTERCARLATEIEAREGRKVELISRKILQQDWKESAVSAVLGRRGRGGREVRGRGGRGGYGQQGRSAFGEGGGGGWGESVRGRGYGPPNSEFDTSRGRGAREGRGRGEGGREFGQRGRGNFQERGRGGFSQRGWRGQGGYGGDNRRVAGRGQRGRGAGEVGGIRGAYGSQGVAIGLEDEQQQGFFVGGCGGFNERGGAGQGRGARGVRGGVRGKERQWGNILSQAYGGHTSHGGETIGEEKRDSWSDQSGSYGNTFSGDGFHGNNRGVRGFHGNDRGGDNFCGNISGGYGFHGNDGRNWSGERGGEEWNRDHVKLDFGYETAVWRGGRGEGGHRGRGWGGHTQEHTPYDRFSDPPHVGPPGASSERRGGWEKGEGGRERRWGGSSDGIGHSNCPPLLGASPLPLPPVEHSQYRHHPLPPPQSYQEQQHHSVDSKAEIFRNLALSTINSEEDAEMALQLSSSLTQALLAYRIKTVPTASPLNEVLSAVKGVSFPDPSNNNP